MERGWTQSGVAVGERQQAEVGILSPQFAACMLEFFLVDKRVCSLHLQVGE